MNKLTSLLGVCLLLCGCSLGDLTQPVNEPPIGQVMLQSVATCNLPIAAPLSRSLFIQEVDAVAPYDQNAMWYSPEPSELKSYSYHQWAAPPAIALQQLVADAIRNSGRYGSVWAGATANAAGGNVLSLQLLSFYQDIGAKTVHLRMVAELNNQNKVSSQVFDVTVPASADYAGMVSGAGEAANQAACSVAKWVVTAGS